ncbi:iduronate-2-sulfatase [Bacteroidia bacterium]|nr:iduronate-2-sulfatase [Bacteroidia bacterium]
MLPALALASVAAMGQKKDNKAPQRPNVIFFMCDQMSAMALPQYGNDFLKTPNIDRLAREGVTFMNSICVVPFSSPSRASFLTGLYPNTHGIISNVDRKVDSGLDPKFPSTEMVLDHAGYETAFFGKWHMGDISTYPCYVGKPNEADAYVRYSQIREAMNPAAASARKGEVLASAKAYHGFGFYQTEYMYEKARNGKPEYKGELSSIGRKGVPVEADGFTLTVMDGIDFIKAKRNKPFMATISISPPHAPFAASNPFYDMVDPAKIPLSPTAYDKDTYYNNNRNYILGQYLGEEGTREKMRCYYAEILFVDEMLGRVLKALDDSGLADNTIVLFTSDHGDPLSSHGFLYGKTIDGFIEELVRTPALIRLPGKANAGKKIRAHFNTVDVAPTLLDYAGQPIPETMQGRSFKPIIEGREKDNTGFGYTMRLFARHIRGEVDGKIYSYSKVFTGFDEKKVREELYNVTDDRYQQKDLIGDPQYASVAAVMKTEFNKFADRNGDYHIEDFPSKGAYNMGNFNKPAKAGTAPVKKGAATAPGKKKAAATAM